MCRVYGIFKYDYVHILHIHTTSRSQRTILGDLPHHSPPYSLGVLWTWSEPQPSSMSAWVLGLQTNMATSWFLCECWDLNSSCLSSKSCCLPNRHSSPLLIFFFLTFIILYVCGGRGYVWRSEDNLWQSSPSTMWILGIELGLPGVTARAFPQWTICQLRYLHFWCYNNAVRQFGERHFLKQSRNSPSFTWEVFQGSEVHFITLLLCRGEMQTSLTNAFCVWGGAWEAQTLSVGWHWVTRCWWLEELLQDPELSKE